MAFFVTGFVEIKSVVIKCLFGLTPKDLRRTFFEKKEIVEIAKCCVWYFKLRRVHRLRRLVFYMWDICRL